MSKIDRYKNVPIINNKYHSLVFYPSIPEFPNDVWITTKVYDRLDLIAHKYYNDSTLWWIIAKANLLKGDSIFIEVGKKIRIPLMENLESIFK